MSQEQPNNPLHGITAEMMLKTLSDIYDWEELSDMTGIRAFAINSSFKSALNMIRKNAWAKTKIENLYLREIRK